jgi:hypothetical protein
MFNQTRYIIQIPLAFVRITETKEKIRSKYSRLECSKQYLHVAYHPKRQTRNIASVIAVQTGCLAQEAETTQAIER